MVHALAHSLYCTPPSVLIRIRIRSSLYLIQARIDRVELKGRIHGKDMKIVKQAAEETYDR
jgi:hypothetical protein